MRKNLIGWMGLLALLLAGCRADQATKAWASESLREAPRPVVPGILEWRYAENRAIAFSMLRDIPEETRKPLIFGLAGFSLLALGAYAWSLRRHGLARIFPFALVLAGAFGNLIDRWRHGFVVDFVHVHWKDAWSFPIFNLADSLITVGMAIWIGQELFGRKPQAPETAPPPVAAVPPEAPA